MKSFDIWNESKKEIELKIAKAIFHESEIWWASIGLNIGDEEDGKNTQFERPVLILRKFNSSIFIGIPLSTKIKNGIYYENFTDNNLNYSVLLSQIKLLSSKRLIRKISKMPRGKFMKVKASLNLLLKL